MKNIKFLNILLVLVVYNNCLFSMKRLSPAVQNALAAQVAQFTNRVPKHTQSPSATRQNPLVPLKPKILKARRQLKQNLMRSDYKEDSQEVLDRSLYNAINQNRPISEIKNLIKQGADVNKKFMHPNGYDFDFPLRLAMNVTQNNKNQTIFPLLECLIKAGARLDSRDLYQETPLHLLVSYCLSSRVYNDRSFPELNHPQLIQLLIDANADIEAKNQFGMTPLAKAAWHGCDEAIKTLAKNHAKINIQDNNGQTPVHLAIRWCSFKTVKLLVELGADLHIKDERRMNALEFAERRSAELGDQYTKIASYLHNKMALEKANPSK